MLDAQRKAYWQANIRLLLMLLAVWFLVSYGFGIVFKEALDQFQLFGFKLGFWWAQQGSIFVFLGLIGIYARQMNRLDRKFGVFED